MEHKTAVVTGGSRGIGKALVLALAEAGYRVALSYVRGREAAEAVCAQARERGAEALALHCDVRDAQSVAGFFAEAQAWLGHIDLLVNNAGITRDGLLATQALEDIHEVIQTNLVGTLLCCQQVIPEMMRQRRGCIVNISSVAAQKPGRGQANYAAAKGGVEALTRALAVELAPRNIRVNAVAPGLVETEMSAALMQAHAEQIHARLLVKRCARPEEIAAAVLFLAEQGSYLTGEVLAVNGGMKMP
ncbi:3-oxoacyl-ACP reductase family protein [Pseudomonas sp. K1(2024)]|uniref:3-oxoacyl-ACP reductase family protein n=1 Tax=Pseudomonas boreofloridensis TaxID=3064348 RepID=A0ABV4Z7J4_9PSED|nr:3-oxoacyl-ACP reductase family protein [Pseudomonas sp. K13]MDO7903547.1 3-oxoacyl-ACP reductase family protein [Pseudomonas sp. K13]